jgi:hypothetical protein
MVKFGGMDFGAHESSTLQLDQEDQLYAKKEHVRRVYEKFEAFDQELEEDSEMENSKLRRSPPEEPPLLPQRSEKRSIGKPENVFVNLESLKALAPNDVEEQNLVSDPHELYLSSEEEGSLSDDYEDSLVDFGSSLTDGEASKPTSRASSRESIEHIAIIVSLTPAGKAQVVEICLPISSKSENPQPKPTETLNTTSPKSANRPLPMNLNTYSDRLSVSSVPVGTPAPLTANSTTSLGSLPAYRPSSLSTVTTNATHPFLASDPFDATANTEAEDSRSTASKSSNTSKGTWRKNLTRTMYKKPTVMKMGLSHAIGAVSQTLPDKPPCKSKGSMVPLREVGSSEHLRNASTMLSGAREKICASPSLPDVESKRTSLGTKMTMMGLSRVKSMKMK